MSIYKDGKSLVIYVYMFKSFYIDNKFYFLVKCEFEIGRIY